MPCELVCGLYMVYGLVSVVSGVEPYQYQPQRSSIPWSALPRFAQETVPCLPLSSDPQNSVAFITDTLRSNSQNQANSLQTRTRNIMSNQRAILSPASYSGKSHSQATLRISRGLQLGAQTKGGNPFAGLSGNSHSQASSGKSRGSQYAAATTSGNPFAGLESGNSHSQASSGKSRGSQYAAATTSGNPFAGLESNHHAEATKNHGVIESMESMERRERVERERLEQERAERERQRARPMGTAAWSLDGIDGAGTAREGTCRTGTTRARAMGTGAR